MARFPAAGPNQPSLQITPSTIKDCPMWVAITNTSAVQVWVSDDQNALDSGAANNGGTPQTGHVIQPGVNFALGKVKAIYYLRAAAPGGEIECTAYSDK